jgi:pimeloyl-ACP methyl ester carboxylesterase
MEPFVFDVGDGGLVSGLKSFPLQPVGSKRVSKGTPLIICLHGESYCAKYYDAHKDYSIHHIANLLHLPVIAINRPGYKQTPELGKTTSTGSDTHLQNEAIWLHRLVLPTIWRAYGPSLGATSMILIGNSVGGGVALITAALNSSDPPEERGYPLSGLILSGLGSSVSMELNADALIPDGPLDEDGQAKYWIWNLGPKTRLMMNSELGQSPLETIKAHESICCPGLNTENLDFRCPDNFPRYWRRAAAEVSIPVMYYMGDDDMLWDTSPERLQDFSSAFMSSPRVETGTFRGAGHCIELSWLGPSWYVKCAGFALECAVEHELLHAWQEGRFSLPSHLSTVDERESEVSRVKNHEAARSSGISESSIVQAWPRFDPAADSPLKASSTIAAA